MFKAPSEFLNALMITIKANCFNIEISETIP